jgi:iron(II)-dependent oxidoreductase
MMTAGAFDSQAAAKRETSRSKLAAARLETDRLFRLVAPSALYERPIPDRHRLVFYLGHVEAFDWNLIGRGALGIDSFHPEFDRLFAFGIDPEPGAAPSDSRRDWPRIDDIQQYNRETRKRIDAVAARVTGEIIHMAVEHRLMHAETLAYLLHNLPYESKRQARQRSYTAAQIPAPAMMDIPAGCATLGQRDGEFGWDNEFKQHAAPVPAFRIAKYKVTNADYLRFVEAGAAPPYFWAREAGRWYWRGMFKRIPLPLDWPVYVTHDEASAYARWAGASLPTEAQFHRAAYGDPAGPERRYPWGDEPPSADRGVFDFHRWDPAPVNATPAGDSAFGVAQLLGNGWEWTSTPFAPFPGFQPHPLYLGYSQPFFDGKHFVLKGASPRTAACMLRPSFRNWFRSAYPYVYAGFRLVENI